MKRFKKFILILFLILLIESVISIGTTMLAELSPTLCKVVAIGLTLMFTWILTED
jgi:hypothetical protein